MSNPIAGLFTWKLHGDGKTLKPGEVVEPDERLTWPRTAEIGAQHVIAMFGATFLVPILTGHSSGAAPCQCFTSAGILMQSPGFISTASLPST